MHLGLIVLVVLGLTAAGSDTGSASAILPPPSNGDYLLNNDCKALHGAFIKAGLQIYLSSNTESYTIIAATDVVIQPILIRIGDDIRLLANFCLSLVIRGQLTVEQLQQTRVTINTLFNVKLTINSYSSGSEIVLNGGRFIRQGVCLNGVVIIVSQVYLMASESILGQIQTYAQTNPLTAVARLFLLLSSEYRTLLSTRSDITVIVPPLIVVFQILFNPRLLYSYIFIGTYYPIDFQFATSLTTIDNRVVQLHSRTSASVALYAGVTLSFKDHFPTTHGPLYPTCF